MHSSARTSVKSVPAAKFSDLAWTAKGERRATVAPKRLDTLWFNTGTLCNIACANCYIESSPLNGRLAYLPLADVVRYLDEIERKQLGTQLIGFTGGEPFMNPDFMEILETTLARGFQTLTLTNAMKPMEHAMARIAALAGAYGERLRLRVSLDSWRPEIHDAERGEGSFAKSLAGLVWLNRNGVAVEVAGRFLSGEDEAVMRAGYGTLFAEHGITLDSGSSQALLFFPEMTPFTDPPEITGACWDILHKSPEDVMCASARMVVKRRGAAHPAVVACTLLPYDERFELGQSLEEAMKPVALAHPYCATFCVLGGGCCGVAR
jgi:uncharacterized Fe-S cluster-containing radical SAM superfamily protein